jgi:hypothetical protein
MTGRVLVPFRGRFAGKRVVVDEVGSFHVHGRIYDDEGMDRVIIDRACFREDLGASDERKEIATRDAKKKAQNPFGAVP